MELIRISPLPCSNPLHETPICPHSLPMQNSDKLLCGIMTRAYSEDLNAFDIDATLNPIILHIMGVRPMMYCMYTCGCMQRLCFGSLTNRDELDALIEFAKTREGIIFPEKVKEIKSVFGHEGYQIVKRRIFS